MSNIQEIWKDIIGYEGLYQISNLGRVKVMARNKNVWQASYISKEKVLKQNLSTSGYYQVALQENNISKHFKVHRLVAIAFIPNPENKPQVNHINGIKTDNRLENLEWATASENRQHAFDIGLNKRGEKHYSTKFTDNDVLDIKERLKKGESCTSISMLYKVHRKTISHIKNNITWKHLDYQE